MKEIPLSQGKVALVDDEDFEWLSKHKWYAHTSNDGKNWYAMRNIPRGRGKQTTARMHRVLLSAPEGMEVDHVNGNGLDNQRYNLRICTRAENMWNMRLRGGSSRHKGVYLHARGKWRAQIRFDGKLLYLGLFTDEIEAARAYDAAAFSLHGEFARLNFPEEGRL